LLTYTVHEPSDPPPDRIDRAERLVFVKDGFSWMAALFTPIWLIVHRLWWPLLGYAILAGVVLRLGASLDSNWAGLVLVALHVLVGLEADTLRRWQLERRDWRIVGSVSGRNAEECERRFFEMWLPTQPVDARYLNPVGLRLSP
jgi:Protein of unknown function (DUF2628)